ncbi:MAG: hypothetical protein ACTHU0_23210 [Kofleriaceae bacterium]
MTRISMVFVVAAALVAGCSKKDEKGGGGGGGGGGKPAEVKLPKLGLVLDAPGTVRVDDAIMGEGHMLMGEGIGAMDVTLAKEPETLEQAKESASDFNPANQKEETLADGWALIFENSGSMGKNYFVQVRRKLDGKEIKCSTTGTNPGPAAAVLAACKSLRKG